MSDKLLFHISMYVYLFIYLLYIVCFIASIYLKLLVTVIVVNGDEIHIEFMESHSEEFYYYRDK